MDPKFPLLSTCPRSTMNVKKYAKSLVKSRVRGLVSKFWAVLFLFSPFVFPLEGVGERVRPLIPALFPMGRGNVEAHSCEFLDKPQFHFINT